VQGVAFDGSNWIFSCNANQRKPDANNKAIYVFKGGQPLKDDGWIYRIKYKDVPHPIGGMHESDDHWGQLTYYDGFVYVSHYWKDGPLATQSSVVKFKDDGGCLEFANWIPLGQVTTSDDKIGWPEFQGVNPWNGKFYTCFCDGTGVREFFIHNPENGECENKFSLQGYLPKGVQGICFSDNWHLYVADDTRYEPWDRNYKWIFYYSALNGAFLGKIPVLAKEDGQELEGICYANTSQDDGTAAQIHAILLENADIALDNIFFKSFSTDQPDLV
jgi:hypothetical protein